MELAKTFSNDIKGRKWEAIFNRAKQFADSPCTLHTMASVAKWTVFFLMALKESRPISGMPLMGGDGFQAEMIRIVEAIRTGDISGFSEQTVLDVLKEINKAGFYFTEDSIRTHTGGRGDSNKPRRGQGQGTSAEEECWRHYLTCEAASIDVSKLLDYLNSQGRIEIPEQGSTAYYQFITSLI